MVDLSLPAEDIDSVSAADLLAHNLRETGNRAVQQASFWAGLLGLSGAISLPVVEAVGMAQGFTVAAVFCGLAAALSLAVNRLAARRLLTGWVSYVVMAVYVSIPTYLFVASHFVLDGGAATFAFGPFALVYSLLIMLSGCLLDPRVPVFTGLVAGVGYGLTGLLAMPTMAAITNVDPVLQQDLASGPIWANRALALGFIGLTVAALSRAGHQLTVAAVTEAKRRAKETRERDLARSRLALAEAEKMAALGQLVAGVAHELNTPLGAIRAAGENLRAAVQHTLAELPAVLGTLDEASRGHFDALTEQLQAPRPELSSREARAARKALTAALEAEGVTDPRGVADLLVDMGVTEVGELAPLLRHPQAPALLEGAYNLSSLQQNRANIDLAAERAAKIVFALKSYAHPGAHAEAETEAALPERLETVLTLYQSLIRRGVNVVRDFAPTPPVRAQHSALDQVWTNLIHNALQAMVDGGTLTVAVGPAQDGVEVSVTDTGPGVPPDLRERIFEPFFTTKPAGEGTGLGLSICRDIVTARGGRMGVQSAPGETTFSVWLPTEGGTP